MQARDGRWLEAAGLVLVRQRPGSAKGVMFITIEDETGIANLVVWVKVFEKYRRIVLSAGMLGVQGRIQREGEVVHLVAHQLTRSVGRTRQRRRAGRSVSACRMAAATNSITAVPRPIRAACRRA